MGEKIKASDSAETSQLIEDSGNTDLTISEVTTFTFGDVRQVFMDDPDTGQDFSADVVLELPSGAKATDSLILLDGTDAGSADENSQILLDGTDANKANEFDTLVLESDKLARLKETEQNISLFKLPKKVVKTLLTTANSGASDTQYTVRRQFVGTTNSSGVVTFNAQTNETFGSHAEKDYTMSILTAGSGTGSQGDIVSVADTISGDGTASITVTDNTVLGNAAKVKLTATILKTSVAQKNKTVKLMKQLTVSTGATDAYGTRPTDTTISLGRADAFELVGVFDSEDTSTDAVAPTITLSDITGTFTRGEKITGSSSSAVARIIDTSSPMSFVTSRNLSAAKFTTSDTITGVSSGATATVTAVTTGSDEITTRYLLDTGQRDNLYDISRIVRRRGAAAPTGKLLIVYDYMEHGAGDVMTVDSYTDVALQMRYDDIPTYAATRIDPDASKPTGIYPLHSAYDFRPRAEDIAGTATSVSTVDEITGNSFDFFSRQFDGTGASTADIGKPGSFIQSDFEYFLPKFVSVHLGENGKFTVTEGVSSENPSLPVVPNIGIKLFDAFLPAYTFDKDNVIITRERHQRYTMKDIGKIDERLDHVEYYTALNLFERDAESFEIIDANGLNRFKSGFVVDNFAGHRVGDTQHIDYKNSIDMENNELRPANKTKVTRIEENVTTTAERTAAGYQRTGHLLTLPYTEETIIEQPFASSVERISAFHTFSWMGDIKLAPSSDEWFEHETAPELVVNVDGNFDAVTNAAVNEIGTVWNAWETQWSGVTATSGAFVFDQFGTGRRSIQTIRTDQTRTGVETKVVAQIDRESQGSKIISTALIPYCRPRNIQFRGIGFKPKTKVFCFFNRGNIDTFVKPSGSNFSTEASPVLGSQLITNSAGLVEGTFEMPDPTVLGNPQFPTGNLLFRITSSSTDRQDRDPITAGQVIYHAKGLLETYQETIIATKNANIVQEEVSQTTSIFSTNRIQGIPHGRAFFGGGGDDSVDTCVNHRAGSAHAHPSDLTSHELDSQTGGPAGQNDWAGPDLGYGED